MCAASSVFAVASLSLSTPFSPFLSLSFFSVPRGALTIYDNFRDSRESVWKEIEREKKRERTSGVIDERGQLRNIKEDQSRGRSSYSYSESVLPSSLPPTLRGSSSPEDIATGVKSGDAVGRGRLPFE